MVKVKVNKECIGCGMCIDMCPDVFEYNDEGLSSVKSEEVDDSMADGEVRGRQNVVFEHGLFIGRLGRNHVMCIRGENVKLPGDINGMVYANPDNFDMDFARELKGIGMDVDANKLFG